VRKAHRRLFGAALSTVLTSGLLVSPALDWWSASSPPSSVALPVALQPAASVLWEGHVQQAPPARVVDTVGVLARVDAAAAPVGALVSAVVVDRLGRTLVQTADAERPVPSASLAKMLVVQRVLARVGPAGGDEATRGRLERAITVSDDAAMNALWTTEDGFRLVQDAVTVFGLTGTSPPADVSQWGQATVSAADVGRFLGALDDVQHAAGGSQLLGWMRATAPVAADGFDQTFGLLSGAAGPGVAAKQGWMCCVDGRRHLHSAGVLADGRVVVVLGEAPSGTSWSELGGAVDGATAALVAGTA